MLSPKEARIRHGLLEQPSDKHNGMRSFRQLRDRSPALQDILPAAINRWSLLVHSKQPPYFCFRGGGGTRPCSRKSADGACKTEHLFITSRFRLWECPFEVIETCNDVLRSHGRKPALNVAQVSGMKREPGQPVSCRTIHVLAQQGRKSHPGRGLERERGLCISFRPVVQTEVYENQVRTLQIRQLDITRVKDTSLRTTFQLDCHRVAQRVGFVVHDQNEWLLVHSRDGPCREASFRPRSCTVHRAGRTR